MMAAIGQERVLPVPKSAPKAGQEVSGALFYCMQIVRADRGHKAERARDMKQ